MPEALLNMVKKKELVKLGAKQREGNCLAAIGKQICRLWRVFHTFDEAQMMAEKVYALKKLFEM